jgi:hypothetical protein
VVDDNVRTKINDYFNALSDQIERTGRETERIIAGRNSIIQTDNAEKTAELEKYQQQLEGIAN